MNSSSSYIILIILSLVIYKINSLSIKNDERIISSESDIVRVVPEHDNDILEDDVTHFLNKNNELSEKFIWKYFLEKYAPTKQFLTDLNVQQIIRNGQKCDSSSFDDDDDDNNNKKNNHNNHNNNNPVAEVCDYVIGHGNHYTIKNLTSVCHQILYLIDQSQCCKISNTKIFDENNHNISPHSTTHNLGTTSTEYDGNLIEHKKKPSAGEVWGYGILFVTLISMCSVVGVSVMPFMGKKLYKQILTVMIGLAVGSLTGSSVFHLIPQAYDLSHHDPSHGYLYTSLVVCGGIWMFFMVERFLKIIMDYKERKDKNWKREKMSNIFSSTPENSTISMLVNSTQDKGVMKDTGDIYNTSICSQTDVIYECQEQAIKASFGHQEKPRCSIGHEHLVKFEQGKDSVIATVAWMIIFGDGLHNFIDGLSIGAAFNESILTGVSISVAVLCEELPHELGDFAVLLNAGMSIRQALLYNFLSACTCYLGMAIGIFLGKVEASQYIFAVAGGMFLYISLVDMVPEMNEVAESSSKISVKKALKVLLLQNVGLFVGVASLFILAQYQDNIQF